MQLVARKLHDVLRSQRTEIGRYVLIVGADANQVYE